MEDDSLRSAVRVFSCFLSSTSGSQKAFPARIGGKIALSRFGYGVPVTRNSSIVPTAPSKYRRTPPPLNENRKKMEFFAAWTCTDFRYLKILGVSDRTFSRLRCFFGGRQRVAGDAPFV